MASKEDCKSSAIAYWKDKQGQSLFEVGAWLPASNMNDAMMVTENLRKRKFSVEMVSHSESSKWRVTMIADWPIHGATDAELPRAICLAALETIK